jgi:hypothetical protein
MRELHIPKQIIQLRFKYDSYFSSQFYILDKNHKVTLHIGLNVGVADSDSPNSDPHRLCLNLDPDLFF